MPKNITIGSCKRKKQYKEKGISVDMEDIIKNMDQNMAIILQEIIHDMVTNLIEKKDKQKFQIVTEAGTKDHNIVQI